MSDEYPSQLAADIASYNTGWLLDGSKDRGISWLLAGQLGAAAASAGVSASNLSSKPDKVSGAGCCASFPLLLKPSENSETAGETT